MYGKCGRWMERKKRVVPGEVCTKRPERDNHYYEVMLNVQKSAEVIAAKKRRTESTGVLSTTGWKELIRRIKKGGNTHQTRQDELRFPSQMVECGSSVIPNRERPHVPTSHSTAAYANLRAVVLG